MKIIPSKENFTPQQMKHIVRIKQHPEKNHFQALEEYLARCRLEGENDFIKESEGILEQMILMKDLMRVASLQESAISTAILGPMMRLLGFYKTTFGVIHEAPVNFRFIGGSYQKIGNEIVLHDEEEEHEVKGKLDFLVLSGKSEEKSEAISYSGIHYLEFWQWQLAIEVKKSNEDLSKYINQLLIYMNINVNLEQPKYGLLTNGTDIILVKLFRSISEKEKRYCTFYSQGVVNLYHILKIFRCQQIKASNQILNS